MGVHPDDSAGFSDAVWRTAPAGRPSKNGRDWRDRPRLLLGAHAHDQQQAAFTAQLELAAELDLPVVIHCRDTHADLRDALRKWVPGAQKRRGSDAILGVLHAYSGDLAMAEKAFSWNMALSLGGPVTFRNARQLHALVAQLPLARLMLETDAPFLTPHPYRGGRNEPAYTALVAEAIADLQQVDLAVVATRRPPWPNACSKSCQNKAEPADRHPAGGEGNLSSPHAFLDLIGDDLHLVEAKMQAPHEVFAPLAGAVNLLLDSGGKRLRPATAMLVGKFYPQIDKTRLVSLAAAIETLHTATLVHDDVVNGSLLRRGHPTLNASWSQGATVLAGDFVFARAAYFAAETDNVRVMRIFAQTLMTICEGGAAPDVRFGELGSTQRCLLPTHLRQDRGPVRGGHRVGCRAGHCRRSANQRHAHLRP